MEKLKAVTATKSKETNTVGKEFVLWAEKYWGLKIKYDQPPEGNGESCSYDYVKDVFIGKIDDIIKERLLK